MHSFASPVWPGWQLRPRSAILVRDSGGANRVLTLTVDHLNGDELAPVVLVLQQRSGTGCIGTRNARGPPAFRSRRCGSGRRSRDTPGSPHSGASEFHLRLHGACFASWSVLRAAARSPFSRPGDARRACVIFGPDPAERGGETGLGGRVRSPSGRGAVTPGRSSGPRLVSS